MKIPDTVYKEFLFIVNLHIFFFSPSSSLEQTLLSGKSFAYSQTEQLPNLSPSLDTLIATLSAFLFLNSEF